MLVTPNSYFVHNQGIAKGWANSNANGRIALRFGCLLDDMAYNFGNPYSSFQAMLDANGVKDNYTEAIKAGRLDFDPVTKPAHYHSGGVDPWTLMNSCFTCEQQDGYDTGSALAYVARWHRKNGIEDIKKAVAHLQRMVDRHDKLKEQ